MTDDASKKQQASKQLISVADEQSKPSSPLLGSKSTKKDNSPYETPRGYTLIALTALTLISVLGSKLWRSNDSDDHKIIDNITLCINAFIFFLTVVYGVLDSLDAKFKTAQQKASEQAMQIAAAGSDTSSSLCSDFLLYKLTPFLITVGLGNGLEVASDPHFRHTRGVESFIGSDLASLVALFGFLFGAYAPIAAITDNAIEGFAIGLANTQGGASFDWVKLVYGAAGGALGGLAGGIIYKKYIDPIMKKRFDGEPQDWFWPKLITQYFVRGLAMEAIRTIVMDQQLHEAETVPLNFIKRLAVTAIAGATMGALLGGCIYCMNKYDRKASHNEDKRISKPKAFFAALLGTFAINVIYNLGVPYVESLALGQLGMLPSGHSVVTHHSMHP